MWVVFPTMPSSPQLEPTSCAWNILDALILSPISIRWWTSTVYNVGEGRSLLFTKHYQRVCSLMLEREQCDCNKEMIANWALLSISSQHYTCNAWSRLKLEYSFWLQIGNENPWEFIDVEVIFLKLHLQVVLSEFKSVDVCALACVNSYWFLVMAYYILKA